MSLNIDLRDVLPANWLDASSTSDQVRRVARFLREQGTFQFPVLPNGLFPAAAATGTDFEASGYHNVWVRDNVQIAYAHFRTGQVDVAVRCVNALTEFFSKHRYRFENVIAREADPADPMCRPHIRFNGDSLTELPEKWAHAQNDAIGYFLWIYGVLVASSSIAIDKADWDLITTIIHYLQSIHYWQDEDSGHWEETRKVSASSIGTVNEGLNQWINVLERFQPAAVGRFLATRFPVSVASLKELHQCGESALSEILPAECIQKDSKKNRRFDSALVFLCYPLNAVDREMKDRILSDVSQHLTGEFGIRRYQGDSYWCANYKDLLAANQRSVDFSDDLSGRDQLLQAGTEAQWCIFDPAISCAYGSRYAKDFFKGRGLCESSLQKQVHHLRRSLAQLTDHRYAGGPFRCPESYFKHRDAWIPNDLTPLLWTQANLIQALWWLEHNLDLS
jgi:hypothetical protein